MTKKRSPPNKSCSLIFIFAVVDRFPLWKPSWLLALSEGLQIRFETFNTISLAAFLNKNQDNFWYQDPFSFSLFLLCASILNLGRCTTCCKQEFLAMDFLGITITLIWNVFCFLLESVTPRQRNWQRLWMLHLLKRAIFNNHAYVKKRKQEGIIFNCMLLTPI